MIFDLDHIFFHDFDFEIETIRLEVKTIGLNLKNEFRWFYTA
jgi:hypothetical protein